MLLVSKKHLDYYNKIIVLIFLQIQTQHILMTATAMVKKIIEIYNHINLEKIAELNLENWSE